MFDTGVETTVVITAIVLWFAVFGRKWDQNFGAGRTPFSTEFSTALRRPHFRVGSFRGYRERSTANIMGRP